MVRFDRLTPSSLKILYKKNDFGVSSDGGFLFWENEGTFLVHGGKEIIVDPSPDVDERILRLIILGPALAVVLHQRGLLALHGASVNVGGRAVVIIGEPGCGKSALAATLYKRGHVIVTDDVTAIQTDGGNGALVFPGFPQLKLWPEVISFFGDDPEKLPRIEPEFDKRAFRTNTNFSEKPIPLQQIYVLDEADEKKIIPLTPQEALVELIHHTYRAPLLKRIGAKRHFSQCASIVNKIPISRLSRPLSLSSLPDVARMVEEDIAHG